MEETNAQEYSQILRGPKGYAGEEQMFREEATGGDQETSERENSKGERTTYESPDVRPLDERKEETQKTEIYDAGAHWHLCISAEKWAIGAVGARECG